MAFSVQSPTVGQATTTKPTTTTTQPAKYGGAPIPVTMTSPTSGVPNLPNAPLPSQPTTQGLQAGPPLPVTPLMDPKSQLPVTLPPTAPTLAPTTPTPTPSQVVPPSTGIGGTPSPTNPTPTVTAPSPLPTPTSSVPAPGPVAAPLMPTVNPSIPTHSPTPVTNTGSLTGTPYSGPTPTSIGSLQSFQQQGPNIDRVGIAKDLLAQFDPLTEAKFRGDLRSATGQAAGLGQLGSGQWRTAEGNVVADRAQQRDAYSRQVQDAALTGSIDDFYKNVGIAQQQQGFAASQQDTAFGQQFAQRQQSLQEKVASGQLSQAQAQLEQNALNSDRSYALQTSAQSLQAQIATGQLSLQQAAQKLAAQAQMFGQAVTQEQLYAYLQNQSFNQGATLLGLGSQGNPSDYALAESNYYGNQASGASQSAAQIAAAYGRGSGSTTTNNTTYNPANPFSVTIDPRTGLPVGTAQSGTDTTQSRTV